MELHEEFRFWSLIKKAEIVSGAGNKSQSPSLTNSHPSFVKIISFSKEDAVLPRYMQSEINCPSFVVNFPMRN